MATHIWTRDIFSTSISICRTGARKTVKLNWCGKAEMLMLMFLVLLCRMGTTGWNPIYQLFQDWILPMFYLIILL